MAPTKIMLFTMLLVALPVTADAGYKYLCTSAPAACEYAPPDAPELGVNVCFTTSNGARLKGSAPCPEGWRAYSITHGEVTDPLLGTVVAYAPLEDACEAGRCVDYVPHDPGTENVMCCENGGPCWPGATCGGVLYWCNDGVSVDDGTVECFDADPL